MKLILTKKLWTGFIGIGLIYAVIHGTSILSPLLTKRLLDDILGTREINWNMVLLYLGLQLLGPILSILSGYLYSIFNVKAEQKLFENYYIDSIDLCKSRITKIGGSMYGDTLVADVRTILQSLLNPQLFAFVFGIFQSLAIILLFFHWNFKLGIIVSAYSVICLLITVLFSKKQAAAYNESRKSQGAMWSVLIDHLSHNRIIRSLSARSAITQQMLASYRKMQRYMLRILKTQVFPDSLNQLLQSATFAAVFLFSLNLINEQKSTVGTLLAMLTYLTMLSEPLHSIFYFIQGYKKAKVSYSRLQKIKADVREDDGNIPTIVPKMPVDHICFENISLQYEQGKQQPAMNVLKEVSIDWGNQKLGLVGVSGEGKSSIIKMFTAETVPTEGRVLVAGTEYGSLSRRFVNSTFNILPQDIEIFNTDLDWNLTLNREVITTQQKAETLDKLKKVTESVINELYGTSDGYRRKRLSEILQRKGIDSTIAILLGLRLEIPKKGLNSDLQRNNYVDKLYSKRSEVAEAVGPACFEAHYVVAERLEWVIKRLSMEKIRNRDLGWDGGHISGGEKQRIALARFLLREFFSRCIIDEPFTGLDIISEKLLTQILIEEIGNRPSLTISHKMDLIRNLSATIIVLDEGRIAASGSHEALMATNELYNKFIQLSEKEEVEKNRDER